MSGTSKTEIEQILKPENTLEFQIVDDPEFIEGVCYGKPRGGNPEGKVLYHTRAVLDNVEKLCTPENRSSLRLIALIRDSGKYEIDRTKPKCGTNRYGYLARKFAEKFELPDDLLLIIELHDGAYNAWYKGG